MLPVIPHHNSEVDGFSIEITPYGENPSKKKIGIKYFRPGFLEILVINNGSNPFCPETGYWEARILTINTGTPFNIAESTDFLVIELSPDEILRSILVREMYLEEYGLGVWMFVVYKSIIEKTSHTNIYPIWNYDSA
ncbi:MAG: hypothetical protein ACI92I_000323 [Acidimicrobiales bacterium]|jgi:hypothetical protein